MSNGLQNKMNDYEVAPPAGVWERIAEALDEAELTLEFPAKLYGIEIAPPIAAWESIKSSLPEEQAVIPEKKKWTPLLRYAAAAVIVGMIAWGSIELLNKRSETKGVATHELIQPTAEPGNTISTKNDKISTESAMVDIDEARNDSALEASKKTFAKLDVAARKKIKKVTDNYFAVSEPYYEPEPETHNEMQYAGDIGTALAYHYELNSNTIPDRYITLMTPDGNIIRMSKKLSDMVCCVSGAEQDENCKDQMKFWRNKIAKSNITASPDNFIDILNLVSSLEDNP